MNDSNKPGQEHGEAYKRLEKINEEALAGGGPQRVENQHKL
jgi:hypothetical protein